MRLPDTFFRKPETLTPSERRGEVAHLLALGLSRLSQEPWRVNSEVSDADKNSHNQLGYSAPESVYARDESTY